MPLPPMYHFTRSVAAIHAVDNGLARAVTQNDPLREPGVWLSPNRYVEGSEFGPIGIRVAGNHLAECECIYVGTKPGHARRHRFVLLPNGAELPQGVARQPTPDGLPNDHDASELLLLGDVPSTHIDGVVFGDERGHAERDSQLEHTFFFAHLLANSHRLLGAITHPHSTVWSVHGGWWTFDKLRSFLVEAGVQQGSAATPALVNAALRSYSRRGLGGRGGLQALERESIHRVLTEAYTAAYLAVTGTDLDLRDDRAYVAEAE